MNADINDDGCVDWKDSQAFESYFTSGNLKGDLDNNGKVDFDDFFLLSDEYGKCDG